MYFKNTRGNLFLSLFLTFSIALTGCAPTAGVIEPTALPATAATVPTEAPTPQPTPAIVNLILATTTSTQDSGLLDVLIPLFEKEYGYVVQTVAVGSGAALKMGQEGNADVLLVHSPAAEKTFMADGWGKERSLVMHNDFIIVGPEADPAGIKGLQVSEALPKIFAAGTRDPESLIFVARADESGTSTKELGMWKKVELDPASAKPAWYVETGQGMGASLTIASEKGGYILTDRATFLAIKANLELVVLIEGDNSLLNIYHVITVDPAKWPKVNAQGAIDLFNFMISETTQAEIARFGMEEFGEPLFIPDATKTDADFGL